MRRLTLLALVACMPLASACRDDGEDSLACPAGLLPGELVVTEIMANPMGPDEGNEWFEIYNPGNAPLALDGVRLETSAEDGSRAKSHVLEGVSIGAGEYLVLGGVLPDLAPAFVDHGYGADLELRNTAGRIAIACDVIEVDAVLYAGAADGASRGFDGGAAPDYIGNDDTASWCDATMPYDDAGNRGSPGAANEDCAGGAIGDCTGDEGPRPVVTPRPGELVVTEIMPNPAAVDDNVGEWFEVRALADFDLNGVTAGRVAGEPSLVVSSSACLPVTAGSSLVFARSADGRSNGGLPRVDATFGFSLVNSSGTLLLGAGDQVLDEITWASSSAGAALAVDPDYQRSTDNDDARYWCDAAEPYGDGDLGTPGADNGECEIPPPAGMCDEGDEQFRPVVTPQPGELLITEIMANPAGDENDREWLEVMATADVDLNGLTVTTGSTMRVLDAAACLRVTAGSYALFARESDPLLNDGLPTPDAVISMSLSNGGSTAAVIDGDDNLIDETTYPAQSLDGYSWSRDAADSWCAAAAADTYGDAQHGTPRAANPLCPAID